MAATRRWLTPSPSRALCLETHQIRPYPQPSPRARTHVASAPKWTYLHGKDRRPHAPAVAGGAAGRHRDSPRRRAPFKFATGQEKRAPCHSVRRCALQPPPRWTAVPRLVLPRAWPAHLGSPLGSRSRPWHDQLVLGVAWALGAAHTAPHCMQHPRLARRFCPGFRFCFFRSCAVLLVLSSSCLGQAADVLPSASGIHHKELGDGQYAEGTPQAGAGAAVGKCLTVRPVA
jgi:hypothetical protein